MDKKSFPVDDFFRRTLEQHTIAPSGEAKKKFLVEAASIAGRNRSRRWIIYLSGFVILIITLVAIRMNMPALIKSNADNSAISGTVLAAPVSKIKPTTSQQPVLNRSGNAPSKLISNIQQSNKNIPRAPIKSKVTGTTSTISKYSDKNQQVQKNEPKQKKLQNGVDPVFKTTASSTNTALAANNSKVEVSFSQKTPDEDPKVQSQPAKDVEKEIKTDTLPKEKDKPVDSVKPLQKQA